jgi:hypothetical protein
MMNKQTIAVFMLLLVSALLLTQCKEENELTDEVLFSQSATLKGFTFYKNNASVMASSNQGGHNKPFRVRFNAIAQAALTDTGKLPVGGLFPEGSMIVKEVYDTTGTQLEVLAVLQKATTNANAGAGWLWAEYDPDGKVIFSINRKGDGCIACHSVDARDKSRLFELFP